MKAVDDLDIPLGAITVHALAPYQRYVFTGWATTSAGREAVLVREMQPGERLSVTSPWVYHCTHTETLLRRFPDLERFRRGGQNNANGMLQSAT